MSDSPVRPYKTVINDSGNPGYVNRLMVATPTTGLVRIEWVQSRYGQVIPTNWSHVQMLQFMDSYMPVRYQVADAQNLIVKEAVTKDFEWLLLWEHDTCPPPDACIRLDRYMTDEKVPVVSGLYYTRSFPSDPLIYRGRGTGTYRDFKMGDEVWCDGVPTGFLLIHCGILRKMWDESAEYAINGQVTRRVFDTPRNLWFDPESNSYQAVTGTSDLDWCTRVMEGDYLRKAGWGHFLDNLPDPAYPFLVDTQIFCKHVDPNGQSYP